MASRNSLEKAKKCRDEIQTNHPDVTLTIVDNSEIRQIGRAVAEKQGFEIVEDNGGVTVTVKEVRFDVLEVTRCYECGSEILTAAIGEIGNDICSNCKSSVVTKTHRDGVDIEAVQAAEEWYYPND